MGTQVTEKASEGEVASIPQTASLRQGWKCRYLRWRKVQAEGSEDGDREGKAGERRHSNGTHACAAVPQSACLPHGLAPQSPLKGMLAAPSSLSSPTHQGFSTASRPRTPRASSSLLFAQQMPELTGGQV